MDQFFADYLDLLHLTNQDFIATFADLPAEALDWIPGEEMNSLCVLVVHTAGVQRFFIGDIIMGESSNRSRPAEFQAHGLSADELTARFAAAEDYARGALERLTLADLPTVHSITNRFGEVIQWTTGRVLINTLQHSGLHLGHAQITRQLWQQRH